MHNAVHGSVGFYASARLAVARRVWDDGREASATSSTTDGLVPAIYTGRVTVHRPLFGPNQLPTHLAGTAASGSCTPVRVVARAHGKVNLHLGVGPLREDGFHDLVSLFQAVSAAETITLHAPGNLSRGPVVTEITVDGDVRLDGIPRDRSNLAVAAVERVAQAYRELVGADPSAGEHGAGAPSAEAPSAADPAAGAPSTGEHSAAVALPEVAVHIHKTIPVQGGMAGGSADCAAALVAADYLYRAYCAEVLQRPEAALPEETLYAIGADLGSDVPFCMLGGTALGAGRGEQLTPLSTQGTYWWVFALSHHSLSTPVAFRTLDAMRHNGTAAEPISSPPAILDALSRGDAAAVGALLANDLDPVARELNGEISAIFRAAAKAPKVLGGIVSGSGPTCALLAANEDAAREVAAVITASGVCAGVVIAQGPADGAQVIEAARL